MVLFAHEKNHPVKLVDLKRLNPFFYVPYVLALILGGIGLAIFNKGDVLLLVNGSHNVFLDYLFSYGTHFGNGLFYVVVILILAVVKYRYALLGLLCFSITGLLTQFLKKIVFSDYARPRVFFQDQVDLHFIEGVKILSKYSFPSGHTATAFSLFCLLALIVPKNGYGMLFIAMALIGGISRIYLVQHFFVDVYFGSILGVLITTGIYYYVERSARLNSWEPLNRGLFGAK